MVPCITTHQDLPVISLGVKYNVILYITRRQWYKCGQYSAHSIYHSRFSSENSQKTPHSSPLSATYGVSFLSERPDWSYDYSYGVICDRDIPRVSLYNFSISYQMVWHLISNEPLPFPMKTTLHDAIWIQQAIIEMMMKTVYLILWFVRNISVLGQCLMYWGIYKMDGIFPVIFPKFMFLLHLFILINISPKL